jgi:hypothetical protein
MDQNSNNGIAEGGGRRTIVSSRAIMSDALFLPHDRLMRS